MKTSKQAVEKLWFDPERRFSLNEFSAPADAIDDAERRATLVFDMLLTVLSCPGEACLINSPPD